MSARHKAIVSVIITTRRDGFIANKISREKMRCRGYHILVKIRVFFATVARFCGKPVFYMTDRIFGKPIFRDLNCSRNSGFESARSFEITLTGVSRGFKLKDYRKHWLVVHELIASAAECDLSRDRLHFKSQKRGAF